jgi:hypothetical protein
MSTDGRVEYSAARINHFALKARALLAGAPQAAMSARYHLVADATLRRATVSLIDRVTSHTLSCNETAVEQLRFINEIAAAQKGGSA